MNKASEAIFYLVHALKDYLLHVTRDCLDNMTQLLTALDLRVADKSDNLCDGVQLLRGSYKSTTVLTEFSFQEKLNHIDWL